MRAISPVIATVIIVSVAIAISIAVALWLTGITSGFTQTENLQIVSSYAEAGKYGVVSYNNNAYQILWFNTTTTQYPIYNVTTQKILIDNGVAGTDLTSLASSTGTTNGWIIKINIKNTGTVAATIDNIFVNNIPINNEKGVVVYNGTQITIGSGDSKTLYIFISQNGFSAGQMVNIKIHTASGRDYPTTITLP